MAFTKAVVGLAVFFLASASVHAETIPNVSPGQVAPPAAPRGEVAPAPSGVSVYAKAVNSVVVLQCVIDGGKNTKTGAGSIISRDGRILTNMHVIEGADRCFAFLKPPGYAPFDQDTPAHRVKILAKDPTKDLALVVMADPPERIVPIELGTMEELSIGQEVHAIGHPLWNYWTYTQGVISQIRLKTAGTPPFVADVVQTQTPISSGNSGGPLLASSVRLLGVNTYVSVNGQNLNFAVAVDEVHGFIQRVRDGEHRLASPDEGGGVKRGDGDAAGPSAGKEKPCEPKKLGESRSKKAPGKIITLDVGCTGSANAALLVPDDESSELILYVSTAAPAPGEDRYYDIRYYLEHKTLKILRSWHDTDRDGKPDYIGIHKNGEEIPSEYIPFNSSARF